MAVQEYRNFEVVHRPEWHACISRFWFDDPCDGPPDWYIWEDETGIFDGPHCRMHGHRVADKQREQEGR